MAPADLQRLTAAPRRHGWHATLKAPFALAPGTDWLTLHHAVQQVARNLTPFTMPPMQVQRIDDFLALVPMPSHAANAALNAAAAACVTQLQPLAAPPSVDELAQRRAAEEFRFHMPLTGPLSLVDDNTQALVLDAAQQFFSDLPTLQFNQLALFAEPAPGADFVLLDHLELGS